MQWVALCRHTTATAKGDKGSWHLQGARVPPAQPEPTFPSKSMHGHSKWGSIS